MAYLLEHFFETTAKPLPSYFRRKNQRIRDAGPECGQSDQIARLDSRKE